VYDFVCTPSEDEPKPTQSSEKKLLEKRGEERVQRKKKGRRATHHKALRKGAQRNKEGDDARWDGCTYQTEFDSGACTDRELLSARENEIRRRDYR